MARRAAAFAPLLAALALPAGGPAPREGGKAAFLVYSSDELAEVRPCACEDADAGGIPRRAAEIRELEREHGAVFTCSAGDVFEFPLGKFDPELRGLKVTSLARALGLLRYDALAVGERDLAWGPAYLRGLAGAHGLRLVCANAYDREGNRLFDPWVVSEKNGVRVAFVGVLSPAVGVVGPYDSKMLEHRIELRDPVAELRAVLPAARREADLVVLLAHVGVRDAESLAEETDADVVVCGHRPSVEGQPRRIGNAIFCTAGAKSDHFGTLRVVLREDGGVDRFSGRAIRLRREGPEDEEIAALAAEIDALEKRREAERDPSAASGEGATGYVGAESCRECHEEIHAKWLATPHARAFESLAAGDEWQNPACIGCHTTGAVDKRRVDPASLDPARINVQCEECHGPGEAHVQDRSPLATRADRCTVCHDAENSPAFDRAKYSAYGIH